MCRFRAIAVSKRLLLSDMVLRKVAYAALALLLLSLAAAKTPTGAEQRPVDEVLVEAEKALRLDRGTGQKEKAAAATALLGVIEVDPTNREAHRLLGECFQASLPLLHNLRMGSLKLELRCHTFSCACCI